MNIIYQGYIFIMQINMMMYDDADVLDILDFLHVADFGHSVINVFNVSLLFTTF